MVVEGEQVVIGDTVGGGAVAYEVLCRRHHMRHMTQAVARAQSLTPQTLQAAVDERFPDPNA
jgi:thymidine kinase